MSLRLLSPHVAGTEPVVAEAGRKAWSLWWMSSVGARVPPAFVLPTSACRSYFSAGERLTDQVHDDLAQGVLALERLTGQQLGRGTRPLLLSVRSSGPVSMPGMMDTLLNVGVNDEVERVLAHDAGPRFAGAVYRQLCADYGRLVLSSAQDLDALASAADVRLALTNELGVCVPGSPMEQLGHAVAAVFSSSRSRRARAYRRHHALPDEGTAVVVQAMVFGNLDEHSGTGVVFTRNPVTGAATPYGEYQPNAQGDQVVGGRVTPGDLTALAQRNPGAYDELLATAASLELAARDAQEIEFTVERGVLHLLQARTAKRAARAAVRIAVELATQDVITPYEAVTRVTADQARSLLRPELTRVAAETAQVLASGLAVCDGVAIGPAVGENVPADAAASGYVLVRPHTTPEDVPAMLGARAVVTDEGGGTSHAAVVARSLGIPCVVGCGPGTAASLVGRTVTVDGTGGRVFADALPLVQQPVDGYVRTLTAWAEQYAPLRAVTSGDGPADAPVEVALVGDEAAVHVPTGFGAVRGAALDTDGGIDAAVAAGVTTVVVTQPLPALLAAIASRAAREGAERTGSPGCVGVDVAPPSG